MIGYAMLGTNDQARANAFYDALLAHLGAKRLMEFQSGTIAWGTEFGAPMLAVGAPYDKKAATYGNGTMISLAAPSRAAIDAMHATALAHGGSCEGPPGLRGPEGPQAFYAAYFRDPDGNKLCAFRTGPA
jgi:catechol 2,3-dioxygenase-like lactoylglutathione lyase family enzyme